MNLLTGAKVIFEAEFVNDGVISKCDREGTFIAFGLKATVNHGGYEAAQGSYTIAIIMYRGVLFSVEFEKLYFPTLNEHSNNSKGEP